MALAPIRFLFSLAALSAVVAAGVILSLRETARLRSQVDLVRVQVDKRDELQRRHDQLTAHATATPPPADDAASEELLARETAALATLREDYERIALATLRRTSKPHTLPEPPAVCATPEDTVQSVIHAIMSGDADRLVTLIDLDPVALEQADAFLASLPPETQAEFDSAVQLVAHVMAAKTRFNTTNTTTERRDFDGGNDATLLVRLTEATGRARTATLRLHRDAEGWRLRVPAKVIEGYRALITGVVP